MDNCQHGCNANGEYLWKGAWYPCPIHGKSSITKEVKLKGGVLPNGESIYSKLKIPMSYSNPSDWVEKVDDVFRGVEGLVHITDESQYALKDIMGKIYRSIVDDRGVYPLSVYLYGSMVDLKPWVFTMQRIAIEQKMSVLPATTINDLGGLIQLLNYNIDIRDEQSISWLAKENMTAAQGADWYLQTGLSYVDYLRASLVFILDDGATSIPNLKLLQGFLAERSRRDLPTYVVSSVYLDRNREPLSNKGSTRYRFSHLTPYLLVSKKNANELSRSGLKVNNDLDQVGSVKGQSVEGYSDSYFGF